MRRRATIVLAALAMASAGMAQPGTSVTLRAGTVVRLSVPQPIHSRFLKQGQRVGLTVAEDVRVGTAVVIMKGTPATGEVEALTDKGMFGKAAKFSLRPLFVDTAGVRVNLTGMHEQRGRSAVAASAISAVAVGVLGLAITGKSATLPAGTILHGEVRSDMLVPVGD